MKRIISVIVLSQFINPAFSSAERGKINDLVAVQLAKSTSLRWLNVTANRIGVIGKEALSNNKSIETIIGLE